MAKPVTAVDALRQLNLEIGEREKAQDVDGLNELLHDGLVFRRADGTIVTKREYLDAVPTRTYDVLETEIAGIDEGEESAVVNAIVTAAGTAKGASFGGTFRNTRVFVSEADRWQCRLWLNTRLGTETTRIHHVSLPVSDLERSKQFYRGTLGLQETARPAFDFPGAWYQVGDNQLHLIVDGQSTFREGKGVNSRDIHFAMRVRSFREALESLEANGYREKAGDLDLMKMKVSERPTAGFPQIYILDPDRNVIEINAERLDL
jgi:glyoxylase I family protein